MAYRDESLAARARLAALERDLVERREAPAVLARYRRALRHERAKLSHALLWYRNGERYGQFYHLLKRDDLSPSAAPQPRLPGVAELERALSGRDAIELRTREREVTRALAALEPRLWGARREIDLLRSDCERLRAEVETFARRHPDHPPPPEWNPLWARALLGTTIGLAGLVLTWLLAIVLIALAGG